MTIHNLKAALLRNIKQTPWYAEVKSQLAPAQRDELLHIAADTDQEFMLVRTDEHDKGKFLYAIVPVGLDDVWMNAFKTKRAALRLCKDMAWTLVK